MKKKTRLSLCLICLISVMLAVLTSCGARSSGNETTDTAGTSGDATVIQADPGQSTADETTARPKDDTVRISFAAAGDNIGHSAVYTDAKNRANAYSLEYNFEPIYNDVRAIIENADISFINQETVMGGIELSGGQYYGYPDFNSPQDMGRTLSDIGFDVVNIANNHMLDWGAEGLSRTIDFWKKEPVMLVGGYTDEADFGNIRIIEEKGVKIAILSYAEMINWSHRNDASGSSLVIPYPKDSVIRSQVTEAKRLADVVIASIHWGDEDSFTPSAEQNRIAKVFADMGVAAVIGHHSHVVQPIEWLDGENGGRTLVVYSLGNFLSTMLYGRNMVGGIITFDIVSKNGETPYVEAPLFIPTVTHYNMNRAGLQIYQLENYSEALAAAHGCHADDPDFTYERAKKYVTDVIGKEFLPEFLK